MGDQLLDQNVLEIEKMSDDSIGVRVREFGVPAELWVHWECEFD